MAASSSIVVNHSRMRGAPTAEEMPGNSCTSDSLPTTSRSTRSCSPSWLGHCQRCGSICDHSRSARKAPCSLTVARPRARLRSFRRRRLRTTSAMKPVRASTNAKEKATRYRGSPIAPAAAITMTSATTSRISDRRSMRRANSAASRCELSARCRSSAATLEALVALSVVKADPCGSQRSVGVVGARSTLSSARSAIFLSRPSWLFFSARMFRRARRIAAGMNTRAQSSCAAA